MFLLPLLPLDKYVTGYHEPNARTTHRGRRVARAWIS